MKLFPLLAMDGRLGDPMNTTVSDRVSADAGGLPQNASEPMRVPWGPFADPHWIDRVRQYRELHLYLQLFDNLLVAKQQPTIGDVEKTRKQYAALGDRAPSMPEAVAQHITERQQAPIKRGRTPGIPLETYRRYWLAVRHVQWKRPNPLTGKAPTIAKALKEFDFGVDIKTYELWRKRIPLPDQGE